MKRTKEGCFQNSNDLTMVSGCREFTGEDLSNSLYKESIQSKKVVLEKEAKIMA